ncbi:MAG: Ig-like domain-containing protein [Bacteroidales bacterium]
MKKQTNIKVLSAVVIMAVSMLIANLQAQDINLEFLMVPEGAGVGETSTGGIGGGRPGDHPDFVEAEDPRIELNFSIGPTGQIGLDAYTPSTVQDVIDAVDQWDNTNLGQTTNPDLYSKNFSLVLRAESRMQLGYSGGHGIGVRGKNQGRLDDVGEDTEWLEFLLTGDVGIDFINVGFTDVSGGDLAHAIIKDHDTDKLWYIDEDPDPGYLNVTGEYNMRYFSDILHFTTADTGQNMGYRLYSLEFNIVPAEPKPPAVLSTTPVHADTTVEITSDYVIQFDIPVDEASAEAAVTFNPVLANEAYAWNETSDILTISHDPLPYSTEYVVTVSTGVKAAEEGGLNMLADTTFTFKTLPEPPTVNYTFPANLAENVPITTPFEIQFSKGMIRDSVEKAIEFTPAVSGLEFIWNEDYSIAYFSTDELSPSTQYFGTVGTVATDRFGVQLATPFQFVFTTATGVGIDSRSQSEMVVYPNPADDVLSIRGIDVKSVKIYNMTGQLVKQISNKPVFNVSEINPGIYVINVDDRNDNNYKEVILIK